MTGEKQVAIAGLQLGRRSDRDRADAMNTLSVRCIDQHVVGVLHEADRQIDQVRAAPANIAPLGVEWQVGHHLAVEIDRAPRWQAIQQQAPAFGGRLEHREHQPQPYALPRRSGAARRPAQRQRVRLPWAVGWRKRGARAGNPLNTIDLDHFRPPLGLGKRGDREAHQQRQRSNHAVQCADHACSEDAEQGQFFSSPICVASYTASPRECTASFR